MNPPTIEPPLSSPAQNSALAVWSLVLGIVAVLFTLFCLGPLFAIPAVICGHMALGRIKRSAGAQAGTGLAIGGLATGYVSIGLSVFILPMMLAIAVPNFIKARQTSQMNACINNLRQIDAAKQQWALENRKGLSDTPTWDDISKYIKNAPLTCPAEGTYTLSAVGEPPTCTVAKHKLTTSGSDSSR